MPFIDGISFLKSLETPPKTIITSAHSDYALDGYDLNVVDYLMKPIPFERFEKASEAVGASGVTTDALVCLGLNKTSLALSVASKL